MVRIASISNDAMSLDVGSRLGHYDVTGLISEGGMGEAMKTAMRW